MKKVFSETGTCDDWCRPIVLDVNQKTFVMVDGFPHPITDWGEPLYPIKDFELLTIDRIADLKKKYENNSAKQLFDFLMILKIISEDEVFEKWEHLKDRMIEICVYKDPLNDKTLSNKNN